MSDPRVSQLLHELLKLGKEDGKKHRRPLPSVFDIFTLQGRTIRQPRKRPTKTSTPIASEEALVDKAKESSPKPETEKETPKESTKKPPSKSSSSKVPSKKSSKALSIAATQATATSGIDPNIDISFHTSRSPKPFSKEDDAELCKLINVKSGLAWREIFEEMGGKWSIQQLIERNQELMSDTGGASGSHKAMGSIKSGSNRGSQCPEKMTPLIADVYRPPIRRVPQSPKKPLGVVAESTFDDTWRSTSHPSASRTAERSKGASRKALPESKGIAQMSVNEPNQGNWISSTKPDSSNSNRSKALKKAAQQALRKSSQSMGPIHKSAEKPNEGTFKSATEPDKTVADAAKDRTKPTRHESNETFKTAAEVPNQDDWNYVTGDLDQGVWNPPARSTKGTSNSKPASVAGKSTGGASRGRSNSQLTAAESTNRGDWDFFAEDQNASVWKPPKNCKDGSTKNAGEASNGPAKKGKGSSRANSVAGRSTSATNTNPSNLQGAIHTASESSMPGAWNFDMEDQNQGTWNPPAKSKSGSVKASVKDTGESSWEPVQEGTGNPRPGSVAGSFVGATKKNTQSNRGSIQMATEQSNAGTWIPPALSVWSVDETPEIPQEDTNVATDPKPDGNKTTKRLTKAEKKATNAAAKQDAKPAKAAMESVLEQVEETTSKPVLTTRPTLDDGTELDLQQVWV
ncbi:MAG: hypothetical protein MMC33_005904 [Icmadophila ericetorum]|nr:hypothetical protein [Icmadophila ericetorum]